ncbi:TPA: reverse transcriptase N-terminal domain-containing protein [Klebsiella aerogenes]|nr:reverse transcriptase N-terminal domain-containing protein [Klebsiella aerogenes]
MRCPPQYHLCVSIDWQQTKNDVFRFQVRIAKAAKAQHWNKVRVLQQLLTRSHQAKLLAVKRVTSNRGRHTQGIDGTLWINPQQKWQVALALSCRGYRAQRACTVFCVNAFLRSDRPGCPLI